MMRLHDFLDFQARDYPDLDFAIFGDQTMSYDDALSLTKRIGNAFVDLGLEKGDRVLSWEPVGRVVRRLSAWPVPERR